jgi:hypothetical protein
MKMAAETREKMYQAFVIEMGSMPGPDGDPVFYIEDPDALVQIVTGILETASEAKTEQLVERFTSIDYWGSRTKSAARGTAQSIVMALQEMEY